MPENAKFCTNCGATIGAEEAAEPATAAPTAPSEAAAPRAPSPTRFLVVTTPTIPGYRVVKILGVVSGLTARTRGVGGKFVAGIQSMLGGEVSAFTMEIQKARVESVQRMQERAREMGANAVMGMDIESSDLIGAIVISATGTAVVVEPE